LCCAARYPALLYIVQGGGCLVGYKVGVIVGLHRASPSRSTGEF
jgi:LytS/YehU family sensor histidine kinase